MQAAAILALIQNVPEDVTVFIDTGQYEIEVGSIVYDEQHGTLSLIPIDDEDDSLVNDGDHDDDEDPSWRDQDVAGSSCALAERKIHGVKDL